MSDQSRAEGMRSGTKNLRYGMCDSLRAAPAEPISLLRSAGGVGLRWDPAAHPMIMVRDTRTGEVLSFARGGNVMVPARGDVELVTSDGVWSRSATVAAPR